MTATVVLVWGVEAWEMTHREEWRREKQRQRWEGGPESFFFWRNKSQEREEKGCERDPMAEVACLISLVVSPESALTHHLFLSLSSSPTLFWFPRLWHLGLSEPLLNSFAAQVNGREPACDQRWQSRHSISAGGGWECSYQSINHKPRIQ